MKPKSARPRTQPQLDQKEMKQLLEGREEDKEEAEGDLQANGDPIKGVGFRRCALLMIICGLSRQGLQVCMMKVQCRGFAQ